MSSSYSQQVPDLLHRNGGGFADTVPSRPHHHHQGLKDRGKSAFTRLQLIDQDQAFSQELTAYMQKKWRLFENGFDYNVVSVFGSQSTGKSTLLNRLFGTRFDVMNDAQRQQTTRGIWADRGTDGMPVLILDVEGTDGRERGENQDFERKSALFSLAISEVLIVNMWEHTVGLYNGANMGLLKTVLEVNLQLFGLQRENRTLLYFVIRDHVSPTPLSSLAKTLKGDLERIWDSLNKPEGLEQARLEDYFDLQFESLPHLLLQPENFEQLALKLRNQFTDKADGKYVFRKAYKRRVPADGFPHYAESVWEKVVSNKDLDLPTQQELLAQYRCDEIAAAAIGPFRQVVDSVRPRVQSGQIVDELGETTRAARERALDDFDQQAARYHAEVYKKKRAGFVQTLDGELHAVYLNQAKNALTLAAESFASEGQKRLEENREAGFGETIGALRRDVAKRFNATVDALAIPDAPWTFASEITQLDMLLETTTAKLRKAEMERVLQALRREARDTMSEVIADHLGNPDDGMWPGVMAGFDAASSDADAKLLLRMESAGVETAAYSTLYRKLHKALWDDAAEALREEVGDQMVLLKLRTALEDRFRYDAAGLPRVWKPSDDIDTQFSTARASAGALLPKFSKVDIRGSIKLRSREEFFPPGYDFTRTLVLITPARAREVSKRFSREADALYLEAKRSMVATQSQVPMWMIALLVFLGWNEAMTVLFNPLYLVLVAMAGGTAFVIHSLGLWGPVFRAVNGMAGMANDQVHHLLVEAVNRTDPAAKIKRSGSSSSSSSSRSRRHNYVDEDGDNIEMEALGSNSSSGGSPMLADSDEVGARGSFGSIKSSSSSLSASSFNKPL